MIETDDLDRRLLAGIPDYISLGGLLKASPAEDGGRRLLYLEASNEDLDHQGEVVLAKALADSADYYLRHGNLDLSHYTVLGPKSGIPNYLEYEIGKPLEVQADAGRTWVKAQLYQGESPMARNANLVWDSLTKQYPPARWYPSVGGSVLAKSVQVNPDTGARTALVTQVLWNNTALDRCPVNRTVGEVSTLPQAVFAKALGGFVLAKGLEAGYGTDSAALTGGAALRGQSLDHTLQATLPARAVHGYGDFRERLAGDIRAGRVRPPSAERLIAHARHTYGLSADEAATWVERFLRDLHSAHTARTRNV